MISHRYKITWTRTGFHCYAENGIILDRSVMAIYGWGGTDKEIAIEVEHIATPPRHETP